MPGTQSFRIAGAISDIKNIDVDTIDGQDVIFWDDIEQAFPRVENIYNGNSLVKLLRDSNHIR